MSQADSAAAYVAPFANLLPPNARLLVQAGAGDGELARHYRAIYPASSILAVDADPAGAQQARAYADRVYQADLDTAGEAFYRQLEWADGWFFDGTLEQFEQPLRVLAQVRKVIQYDACVLARIANGAHWKQPDTPARHRLEIATMLALFERSGFRVVNGILLNPAPLPADVEAALRAQAAQTVVAPVLLMEAVQPSHYLIKAMPA
jgi:hypothetical protein